MKNNIKITITIIVLAIVLGFIIGFRGTTKPLGSIVAGQDYNSVVTATGSTNKDLLKLGAGTLGSVVITGAAAGTFEIYDATTTNSSLRTITATSSLRKLASFPASTAAGTYVFDSNFRQGLIVAFVGVQGTTTVTFR